MNPEDAPKIVFPCDDLNLSLLSLKCCVVMTKRFTSTGLVKIRVKMVGSLV